MKNILPKSFLTAALAGGIALSASAEILISEDFENGIGNWNLGPGQSLDSSLGNPGNSGAHDGTASFASWAGDSFSVTPTDDKPLRFAADIYYTGSGNQRNSLTLHAGGSWFEMGFYNSPAGLAVRMYNFLGAENWVSLLPYYDGTTNIHLGLSPRWLQAEAIFYGTSMSYEVREMNGTLIATFESNGTYKSPFNDVRFGGPSGLASAGGGFNVDNIQLEVIPEPSTYAAIFGGLALIGAFVYRRRTASKN